MPIPFPPRNVDYRWCGSKNGPTCCLGHDEEYHAMHEQCDQLRKLLEKHPELEGELEE